MNPQDELVVKRFVVYRRLIELLLPCILFSALITFFNASGLVIRRYRVVLLISAFVLVFTVFNFRNLRKCYIDILDKKLFFILNFLSHAIFAAINLVFFAFAPDRVYVFMFTVTEGLRFVGIDAIYSVLIFHLIGFVSVVASTIGMGWVFNEEDDNEW